MAPEKAEKGQIREEADRSMGVAKTLKGQICNYAETHAAPTDGSLKGHQSQEFTPAPFL